METERVRDGGRWGETVRVRKGEKLRVRGRGRD